LLPLLVVCHLGVWPTIPTAALWLLQQLQLYNRLWFLFMSLLDLLNWLMLVGINAELWD
jgi:hypothetical protein